MPLSEGFNGNGLCAVCALGINPKRSTFLLDAVSPCSSFADIRRSQGEIPRPMTSVILARSNGPEPQAYLRRHQ